MDRLEDPRAVELPQIVVDIVRDILKLAEILKQDLSQFVLGSMGEAQLRRIIHVLAQERERELVMKLWGSEKISMLWSQWLSTLDQASSLGTLPPSQDHKWVLRLIQALSLNSPVSCNIPSFPSESGESGEESASLPNQLPPLFFLLCPTLLSIQNYLQALVIAASLRSLVRLPPPFTSDSPSPANDFMTRIWTLLSDEIDQELGDTKLINLADEIIRIRRLIGGNIEEDEEKRLRAAVDRTLQPTDPVFQLLQRRLLRAVAERLVATPSSTTHPPTQSLPAQLQSGRGTPGGRSGKKTALRPGLPGVNAPTPSPKQPETLVMVKGFDDAALAAAVTSQVERLRVCIGWVEEVWPDTVGVVID